MKLGINGWRLQTRTGVARVLLNIIKHWTRDFVADRFQKITLYSPMPLSPELSIPSFVERQIVEPNFSMLGLGQSPVRKSRSNDDNIVNEIRNIMPKNA
jgi:hypothetical protein